MAGFGKLIYAGEKGEGALASKLGAALGAKAIESGIDAESKAAAALAKLKEKGVPVYKADEATLLKNATENPKASVDDLANDFEKTYAPPKPKETLEPTPTPEENIDYSGYRAESTDVSQLPERGLEGMAEVPEVTPTFGTAPSAAGPVAVEKQTSRVSRMTMPLAAGAAVIGLTAAGDQILKDKKTGEVRVVPKDRKQEQPAMPTAPAVGGAEPRPAVTEPTIPPATGKEEITEDKRTDEEKALASLEQFQNRLGASKKPNRSQLEKLLSDLEKIKPDADIKDPATRNFLQDKAEAYRAYKEKADRNEWLGLAQNLVNSLTQFASAQAATGTRFVGGGLPLPSTDYGARTEQAFREYRAQVGDIGEEQRLASAEQERVDRLRRESVAGQRATLQDRIASERENIRQQESDAKEAGRDALTLFNTLQTNKRAVEQNQTALERAMTQFQGKQDAAAGKQLDSQIGYLAQQEAKLRKELDASNELMVADKKNYETKLANWAALSGQNVSDVVSRAEKEKGFFTGERSWVQETLLPTHTSEVQKKLQEIGEQLQQARAARGQVPGEAPVVAPRTVPATPPPATATTAPSTTPAAGGTMVTVKLADGKQGSIPASQLSKFLQDNPGSSRVP